MAPLVSGFLIDLDHFLDYAMMRLQPGRAPLVLPLHGWEYLPLWAALDRRQRAGGALFAGYAAHLVVDQIWNEKRSPWAYFLIWRARRGFSEGTLGPVDPVHRHKWRRASPLGLLRWF